MEFDVLSIVQMIGGLALFIYGMTTMGKGLERAAGSKLEKTLEKMTGNVFTALIMGMVVTMVIQSSSATTVMVVGFVNAGIMTLKQSVGVILGANIGTTVTAQILRLSGGDGSGNLFMDLLKPKNLAYIIVLVGVIIMMLAKKRRTRDIADIFTGFGILFIGMAVMEGAVAPLADLPQFADLFAAISNPVLGVVVGAGVTAIIQSSSASVGILQALSTTGAITYSAAIPIILGQNIGTCITAFLSSLGGSKNARRTAMVHFYFNLIGSIAFLVAIYAVQYAVGFSFWENPIDKGGIANFHTLFNVTCTLLFLPFTGLLVKLARWSVPTGETQEDPLAKLEPRFLTTPALALDQAQRCIADMGEAAKSNFHLAVDPMFGGSAASEEIFREHEAFLDRAEVEIGRYLTTMHNVRSVDQRRQSAEMMHSLSDFEKIGDYAQNIFDRADEFRQAGLSFSATAMNELHTMTDAVSEVLDMTVEAYVTQSVSLARSVEPLEEVVDTMKEQLKSRHIERLGEGGCTMQTGIHFLDIVHDLEKISDHCSNIAIYTIQLVEGAEEFDTHAYAKAEFKSGPQFESKLKFYQNKYLSRLNDAAQA
ncbi:Na/Pi cotransporter family protein [Agathobaculum hominis]|uniref:Na/Pi cotransporter family protein n=1 Tax=Agathobaculum hominis TaxID=2763014 RepID=A0ABR7GQD0_9FIRM|nr:Na/Pi cotransporter family protein [Agathobaculum hominis]MBC5696522.1 Na/Pi cotransporter family protein [Agathobaculum hominis]MEE0389172.1 Na/Pi cotransporter family protein [Agathobaculum sp.]